MQQHNTGFCGTRQSKGFWHECIFTVTSAVHGVPAQPQEFTCRCAACRQHGLTRLLRQDIRFATPDSKPEHARKGATSYTCLIKLGKAGEKGSSGPAQGFLPHV